MASQPCIHAATGAMPLAAAPRCVAAAPPQALWPAPLLVSRRPDARSSMPAHAAHRQRLQPCRASPSGGGGGSSTDRVPATDAAAVQHLKQTLLGLAGELNGTNRSDAQRDEINGVIAQLEAACTEASPATVDLAGTDWQLVYTSSTGNSSGKLGPVVGRTTQHFPADARGEYVTASEYGPGGLLRTSLRGRYSPSGSARINLVFEDVTFELLGGVLRYNREFPPDFRGHWVARYVDGDLRIVDTNQDNVFVLKRI